MTTYVKNADGKVIGMIRKNGHITNIFDKNGRLLGFYNPNQGRDGTTFDKDGRVVARGECLSILLEDEQ